MDDGTATSAALDEGGAGSFAQEAQEDEVALSGEICREYMELGEDSLIDEDQRMIEESADGHGRQGEAHTITLWHCVCTAFALFTLYFPLHLALYFPLCRHCR
jgi:hypothetical protein